MKEQTFSHIADHHPFLHTPSQFTREDAEFLTRNAALNPTSRIRAVETGG